MSKMALQKPPIWLNDRFCQRSPGQSEGGLGFLDLLVDGAHIAREIAGVQRQRDYQFAQGFSHKVSL